jgi:hypothetical protein
MATLSPRSRGGASAGGESHHDLHDRSRLRSTTHGSGVGRPRRVPRLFPSKSLGNVPGQASWLSGHRPNPSPSHARQGTVAGGAPMLRSNLEGSGSPITVAGPRPICTAFPFSPELGSGAPAEQTMSNNNDGETLLPGGIPVKRTNPPAFNAPNGPAVCLHASACRPRTCAAAARGASPRIGRADSHPLGARAGRRPCAGKGSRRACRRGARCG